MSKCRDRPAPQSVIRLGGMNVPEAGNANLTTQVRGMGEVCRIRLDIAKKFFQVYGASAASYGGRAEDRAAFPSDGSSRLTGIESNATPLAAWSCGMEGGTECDQSHSKIQPL